jgi:hypothetical protein
VACGLFSAILKASLMSVYIFFTSSTISSVFILTSGVVLDCIGRAMNPSFGRIGLDDVDVPYFLTLSLSLIRGEAARRSCCRSVDHRPQAEMTHHPVLNPLG